MEANAPTPEPIPEWMWGRLTHHLDQIEAVLADMPADAPVHWVDFKEQAGPALDEARQVVNLHRVLLAFKQPGRHTLEELCEETGLSADTVQAVLEQLLEDGIITPTPED